MFGNRYFAPKYFGDRYFGGAGAVPIPDTSTIDSGAGSGHYKRSYKEEWDLQQAILEAQFKVEKQVEVIQEQIEDAQEELKQVEIAYDLSGLKSKTIETQKAVEIDYNAQRLALLAEIEAYKARLKALRDYQQMIDDEEAILLLM